MDPCAVHLNKYKVNKTLTINYDEYLKQKTHNIKARKGTMKAWGLYIYTMTNNLTRK